MAELRAGFVGLGNIGRPMAERLVAGGLSTTVFDVDEGAVAELVELGAVAAGSCRELAEAVDVVGVCVRTAAQVEAVCTGDEGLFAAASPAVVAVHSTISLDDLDALAGQAEQAGVVLLDACITGGGDAAASGELTYFVGGDEAAFGRARPAFATSARAVQHCGELGMGTRWKLVNNLITNVSFAAVFEGVRLAESLAVPAAEVMAVLGEAGVLSDRMQRYAALPQLPAGFVEEAGMTEAQEGFAEIAVKDLTAAREAAGTVGAELPFAALAIEEVRRLYGLDP